jgi:hypothetical protein
MLGIGGRFVGAKGMVAMPNLANLSPSASNSAILAAGLRPGTVSVVDTSTQSNNDKTFLQSVSAGTLVDLESLINYSYYRYVAPAVVYTLDSQKDTYSQSPESGCNQSPNLQNASNQYFFCTRTVSQFRYKLLANGIWDGSSYGGYGSEASAWNCSIVADQCGNTERARDLQSPGECQVNNTKNVTYLVEYKAGNTAPITVVESCTYVPPTQEKPVMFVGSRNLTGCVARQGCPAGANLVQYFTRFIDNTERIDLEDWVCCTCEITYTDTPFYYFGCEDGFRRCTYRTEGKDCTGTLVSDTRKACTSLCCSPDVVTNETKWTAAYANVEERTVTYRRCNGTTYTATETRCVGCEPTWTSSGRCTSGRLSQSRTCYNANCTTFTERRTIPC